MLTMQPYTRFLNNYVGLYYNESPGSSAVVSAFRAVSFEGNQPLKLHYDGATTYPWAYAGIEMHNQGYLKVGDLYSNISFPKNSFKNLRNGILFFDGELEVYSSDFLKIEDNDDEYAYNGYAIRLEGVGPLRVRGNQPKNHCTFSEIKYGVNSLGVSVEVQNCEMTDAWLYGIQVENASTGATQSADVELNNVDCTDAIRGIFLKDVDHWNLSGNTVSMTRVNLGSYWGIGLVDSDYNNLCQNFVRGDYDTNIQGSFMEPSGILLRDVEFSLLDASV